MPRSKVSLLEWGTAPFDPAQLGQRPALVLMAGGLTDKGDLPAWVEPRVRCAVTLSRQLQANPTVFCSSSFTMNKLPIQQEGRLISEASILAREFRRLRGRGRVVCEQQSHDTVGSAVFLSLLYFRAYGIRRAAVISSDWHIDRCALIFDQVARLSPWIEKLVLIGVPDGAPVALRAQRVTSERKSAALFRKTFGKARNMDEMFRLLAEGHTNYNQDFAARRIQTVLF